MLSSSSNKDVEVITTTTATRSDSRKDSTVTETAPISDEWGSLSSIEFVRATVSSKKEGESNNNNKKKTNKKVVLPGNFFH